MINREDKNDVKNAMGKAIANKVSKATNDSANFSHKGKSYSLPVKKFKNASDAASEGYGVKKAKTESYASQNASLRDDSPKMRSVQKSVQKFRNETPNDYKGLNAELSKKIQLVTRKDFHADYNKGKSHKNMTNSNEVNDAKNKAIHAKSGRPEDSKLFKHSNKVQEAKRQLKSEGI